MGGGIAIVSIGSPTMGSATLTNVTLAYNSAGGSGGGIAIVGSPTMGSVGTLTNVTLAYNSAGGSGTSGGGILVTNGSATLTNVTLAYNSAGNRAGGISSGTSASRMILQNTVLARNTTQGSGPDCSGPVTSLGNNLLGDPTGCTVDVQPSDLIGDPRINDFTDDGTPGRGYFPLLPESPAIDAGNDAVCPPTDQLGQSRVKVNPARPAICDIGAIEFQPFDMVSIRQAIFVDQLSVIFVVATSSAAPEAELFVTVPGCLTEAPMLRIVNRYLFLRDVHTCGNLDDHTATVTSSHGGSASAPLR
jgi:hypothetical protein